MAFSRNLHVTLGGLDLALAATFGAAEEIKARVADPIAIGREAEVIRKMIDAGIPYQPRFSFDVENIPTIIYIGAKASGGKATLAEVKEAAFAAGYEEAANVAARYLGLILGPAPEESLDGGKDAPPGE
jgi:hypothetical protein